MLAYASGDAAAFELLYTRHKTTLFQFIYKSCGNEALAGEIYQDTWLRVVKSRESYLDDAPFGAWLYRIAKNRLTDHHRQQANVPAMISNYEDTQSNVSTLVSKPLQPDEIASLSQRSDVLNALLQELPAEQREAILLRHIAGMSISEIARMANTGAETVKSRLRYAVNKIRSRLKESS